MLKNHQIIFVVNDLGPGQVPHVVQDPRRGCAGQGQQVVKGQGSGQTDAKFVGFSFVGWKKFKEIFPALKNPAAKFRQPTDITNVTLESY